MANRTYWTRAKYRNTYGNWQKVIASSKEEALGKRLKGTKLVASDVQITTRKPTGY